MASSTAPAPMANTAPGAASVISGAAITNAVFAYVLRPLIAKVNVNTLKNYRYYELDKDDQDLIQEIFHFKLATSELLKCSDQENKAMSVFHSDFEV